MHFTAGGYIDDRQIIIVKSQMKTVHKVRRKVLFIACLKPHFKVRIDRRSVWQRKWMLAAFIDFCYSIAAFIIQCATVLPEFLF